MDERELKVIRQRIAARMETREDTQALADEVGRLRATLDDLHNLAGDPEISAHFRASMLITIKHALGDS